MAYNNIFFKKKVLITGNTGFKGSWLSVWLLELGADVYGFSLDIPTEPSMYEITKLNEKVHQKFGDIRDNNLFNLYVQEVRPDFIIHLAAQALVFTSYKFPLDTITTNVIGTAVVCEAIKNISWNCTCIIITSDKVYDNVEWIWGYREEDKLGGKDIYSGSKGAAELVINSYWHSFIKNMNNIKLGVTRAGNVIGGGDWSKDRIVVDCILSFSHGASVEIRSPKATRPWQHVLEPLSGYLTLAWLLSENKCVNGDVYNFGPRSEQLKTVFELVQDLALCWGLEKNNVVKLTDNIPFHEATLLKLNCDKALAYLNWHSTLCYDECVRFIGEWYKGYYSKNNTDLYEITKRQISEYTNKARDQKLEWAL